MMKELATKMGAKTIAELKEKLKMSFPVIQKN